MRIKRAREFDHRINVVVVLFQLIAHAPADDARMVVIALNHLPHPLFGERIAGLHIGIGLTPDRNLRKNHEALFVEVIKQVGR